VKKWTTIASLLLETLIYTYPGSRITSRKADIKHNIDAAREKLTAAE
jgi:hypothetical protein